MSKKRIVEIVDQGGIDYGQISHPNDIVLQQQYIADYFEQVTKDFLVNQIQAEVWNGDYSLITNTLDINIAAARVYRYHRQYEADAASLTLNAADAVHPRIDLIIATLADDVPTNISFVPFQRLRTAQEFSNSVPPYPPTQFQRATEKHHVATISVKTGTPSATPTVPNLGTNEIALYSVSVAANATTLSSTDITDLRKPVTNLSVLGDAVTTLQTQIIQALNYQTLVKDFSVSFGRSDTLLGILNDIASQLLVLRYRYPSLGQSGGRLPSSVIDENNNFYIHIPVGHFVQFGNGFVGLYAENFPSSVNAHYVTAAEDQKNYQPIYEGQNVTQTSSAGNFIRFDAPSTTKFLSLNRAGQFIFRDTPTPTNSNECLLLKIINDGVNPPTLKQFWNLRDGIVRYSKTVNNSDPITKQFEYDLGVPVGVGYVEHYAVDSNNMMYKFPALSITPAQFDGVVDITGVADGDTWHVIFHILSGL